MNRRDFVRILPLAALPPLLAGDEPETTIVVHVTKPNGKPFENAYVILDFLGDKQVMKLGKRGKVHWEMRANLEGIAHFPPIRRGKVRIQVIPPTAGYQTYGQVFDLTEDEKKVEVKLNAQQRQYSVQGDTSSGAAKTQNAPKQQPPN